MVGFFVQIPILCCLMLAAGSYQLGPAGLGAEVTSRTLNTHVETCHCALSCWHFVGTSGVGRMFVL